MLKKYITVAGITPSKNSTIVDGDREVDQGPVILIVIDMHLEISTIFKMIKKHQPNTVLLTKGIISILPKNTTIVEGNTSDQFIIDSHMLGEQAAVLVTIRNCCYSKQSIKTNSLTNTYPLGNLDKVLSIVSMLS